jgi:glucan phosphoethanolaminetransferase (alkaline phosphatase superfamily)
MINQEVLINMPIIIATLFWALCLFLFSMSVLSRKKELWKMVLGADKRLQASEAVIYYWLWLFPIMVFIILLLSIMGIKLDTEHIELIKWILGSLDVVLAVIFGHNAFQNRNKDARED